MDKINILKYHINSAQGDLYQTVAAIKDENIKVSSKMVSTLEEDIQIPYFLFEEESQDNPDAIYKALSEIVSKTVDGLDAAAREETALIVGTSLVDWHVVNSIESTVYDYKKTPYYSEKKSIDSYAKELSKEFGLNGFTMTINTACTSSVNALLEGSNLINSGLFKYVVVIGLEIFSKMMSSGFSSMKLLSTSSQKPFDQNRDGLILGEGIASILIGKDESQWSLKGGYSNCNSINITSVSPSGDEYVEVMQNALDIANVKKEELTALKAHATSTQTNDLSEINAISKIFDKNIVFTALKPYVGHTLGACGTLELAIFMASVDNGFIPKTLNHTTPIIQEYSPLTNHKECDSGIFMLNYFGFGGNNTSIIIEKESL